VPESNPNGKLALLVGGGPAPGINGVISSVTIEAVNNGTEVLGIKDGYKWLVQGDVSQVRKLSIDEVSRIQLDGGSILGTSRTNPAKDPEDMQHVLGCFRQLGITDLVSIGGDDTAYSASQLYKQAAKTIRVAHVPKTIDNDLPLPGGMPTFGFETARQVGVFVARNLAEDSRTTGRWYICVSMGRAAGHLALGIGKAAAATLTIIPEEFRGRRIGLGELCDIILGAIIKRRSKNRTYGLAVLAEGLIETVGEAGFIEAFGSMEKLSRYGNIVRDPHGHLRLGEIDFGRIVKDCLISRAAEVGLKLAIVDKDLGYELRCADPIPYDAEYTRDLGFGAFKFLRSPLAASFGAVISFVNGKMRAVPFEDLINPATGRMLPRRVDVDSESYECARRYMIRLDRDDFENTTKLARLAGVVNMPPDDFRNRFGYLVENQ
jgi:6-phosphofructokinase 1